jgi:anhydro-N-acetylmuramic acid kinase
MTASAVELTATDHAYGRYLGELVTKFVADNQLNIQDIQFISSHGHTIFHQPGQHISRQVGHGAYLAAAAGRPVVCDFRTLDIALGGQGAPLVPIGDQLLFPEYDFCLNLGGIANVSFQGPQGRVSYDICACNMLLNTLANQLNLPYDAEGKLAAQGVLDEELLQRLNEPKYFNAPYPKSLGKEWVDENSLPLLLSSPLTINDKLATASRHIAYQVAQAIQNIPASGQTKKILVTGGGAFNSHLLADLRAGLGPAYEVVVPDSQLINFKEALVFAFLGVLRWRQEPNCLQTVTGAKVDNVGGAIYWC